LVVFSVKQFILVLMTAHCKIHNT